METNEEVLVVIQAESGEEIALPLAALDEQHQEVVVESNGTTTPTGTINDNNDVDIGNIDVYNNANDNHQQIGNEQQSQDSHQNHHEEHDQSQMSTTPTVDTTPTHISPTPPRQKQKRKEKLVCLPLYEEDLKLEFQFIEEPAPPHTSEAAKRKPRKEYRTKKKMAMEAARTSESCDTSIAKTDVSDTTMVSEEKTSDDSSKNNHNDSHNKSLNKRRRVTAKEHKSPEIAQVDEERVTEADVSPLKTTPKPRSNSPQRQQKKEPKELVEEPDQTAHSEKQNHNQTPNQPLERRTRLSNSCRVATGKSYKCNDCGYSTERINNISLHIKKTCPKLFAK